MNYHIIFNKKNRKQTSLLIKKSIISFKIHCIFTLKKNYSISLKIPRESYLLKIYLLQEFIFKVYKYLKAYFKILSRPKIVPT